MLPPLLVADFDVVVVTIFDRFDRAEDLVLELTTVFALELPNGTDFDLAADLLFKLVSDTACKQGAPAFFGMTAEMLLGLRAEFAFARAEDIAFDLAAGTAFDLAEDMALALAVEVLWTEELVADEDPINVFARTSRDHVFEATSFDLRSPKIVFDTPISYCERSVSACAASSRRRDTRLLA
jgi:hypothetical protein